jgi:glycosyltransferase involved in cell wall biosynthesis
MSLTHETVRLLAVCPAFPLRECGLRHDSNYLERTLRELARLSGGPIRVLALRREGEATKETGDFFEVTRVDPPAPFLEGKSLDSAASKAQAFHALAEAAALAVEDAHEEKRFPVAWVYGSECAWAASVMKRAGAAVVGVVHRLRIEEALHALRAPRGSTTARFVMSLVSRSTRDRMVRWASAGAGLLKEVAWESSLGGEIEQLRLERRLMKACDQLVFVGEHLQYSVHKHYPETVRKSNLALPGVTVSPNAAPRVFSSRRRLLLSGQGHPLHGWECVVRALEDWKDASCPSVTVLAGPQPKMHEHSRDLLERLYALPMVQVVRSRNLAASEWMANLRDVDGFLLPSLVESCSEQVLAAMAEGLPIVTSFADGPRDVMEGDFGFRAALHRPSAAAADLGRALRQFTALSNERLSSMSLKVRAFASGFSWENCGRAHWEACLRAVEVPRAHASGI